MKKQLTILLLIFTLLFINTRLSKAINPTAKKTITDTVKINEYFIKANEHLNYPDSAIIYYQKALEIAQDINAGKFIALSYKYIGTSYYYKSDFNNAYTYWEKSLQEYKSINDKLGIAKVLGNIAIIYEYKSNYNKSLKTYREALNISEEINDKNEIARNLGHIGIMFEYQSDYIKALEYYQRALKINEETGNKNNIAGTLTNIGILYKNQNDFDKAIEYYNQAIQIYKEQNDYNKIARIYINIGIIYIAKNNYQEALKYSNKALEINKKTGDKSIIASNLENIGNIYENQKKYSLALENYKKSLEINNEIGDRRAQTTNLINIASVHNKQNDFSDAVTYANKALISARETGDLNLERNIYNHLSDAYFGLNDLNKAIEYINFWIELNDSIYNIEKSKAITEIQTRYETEKKDQEIESLQKDNEIQKLQLEENKQRTKAQRMLFLALAFILFSILLAIWFVYKNYKKQQTIKQQKLQYQKVLTEQKMLRSQMNPHFIFNSLNSIQSFISLEKPYEAEKYLAKFAKLIRDILENSREDLICLEKEIEILELYLSLEQLRFMNCFSYKIKVDKSIEKDFISIPPMLIQPFVENAIIHGLKNKDDGNLLISFFEKNDFLICEIDDNGIGREASMRTSQKKNHKSLATEITLSRLNALSKEFNKPTDFTIEDKIDPVTKAALGTKVTIQIPLIEN